MATSYPLLLCHLMPTKSNLKHQTKNASIRHNASPMNWLEVLPHPPCSKNTNGNSANFDHTPYPDDTAGSSASSEHLDITARTQTLQTILALLDKLYALTTHILQLVFPPTNSSTHPGYSHDPLTHLTQSQPALQLQQPYLRNPVITWPLTLCQPKKVNTSTQPQTPIWMPPNFTYTQFLPFWLLIWNTYALKSTPQAVASTCGPGPMTCAHPNCTAPTWIPTEPCASVGMILGPPTNPSPTSWCSPS